MQQITLSLISGKVTVETVPAPLVRKGAILIKGHCSLVSAGTEKMLVAFGNAGWIDKARLHPDKAGKIWFRIGREGFLPVIRALLRKLRQPLPLGYCHAGEVIAIGEGVKGFRVGDRVVSNGPHAEIVCVPQNLVAAVPPGVSCSAAVFAVPGAIALQGIRLLQPALGETVVVIGLGLIGNLAADLLKINGCRVMCADTDPQRVEMASTRGHAACILPGDSLVRMTESLTNGLGADGVIIAAATTSDNVVSLAARVSRKRGKIVLVGAAGLKLNRADFYEKELSFQVSCSYGPGRYDPAYEEDGNDYPFAFVRWTARRNFEAVLQLIASGALDVSGYITRQVPVHRAGELYASLATQRAVAPLICYTQPVDERSLFSVRMPERGSAEGKGIGIIGAGNFVAMTLLPMLKREDIRAIASMNGLSAANLAKRYGIAVATTDYRRILNDPGIGLVVIATPHYLHGVQVLEALKAGKHVFVEKPVAIFERELAAISAYLNSAVYLSLTVGFNRRFSPFALKMKALVKDAPMNIVATMNAGHVPSDSWLHHRERGGGRLLGEACHLVDLVIWLTGSRVTAVCAHFFGVAPTESTDSATVLLRFANGSTGTIHYFTNGDERYQKERIEAHVAGRTLIMDDFMQLKGYGFKDFSQMKSRQDKGHRTQFRRLTDYIRNGGEPLMNPSEIIQVGEVTLAVYQSLKEGGWVKL